MARQVHQLRPDHGLGRLEDEIRQARTAHADKLVAIGNIHDAAVLRLQSLRDELAPLFAANPAARRVVDLALVPGEPPRLWVDMTTYVVMSPNPSTYRLQRDSFCRHEVLLETIAREQVVTAALQHVASNLVEREKQLQLAAAADLTLNFEPGAGTPSLALAWLSGLTLGIAAMSALLQWAVR
jgi:hypothetical protein